jgi:hypothetical protein
MIEKVQLIVQKIDWIVIVEVFKFVECIVEFCTEIMTYI